jgi:hypothetical protein
LTEEKNLLFARKDILITAADHYSNLLEYHRQIKSFYQFLERQFSAEEYGVKLEPIAKMVWNQFRIELTCEDEINGWLTGYYARHQVGYNLKGKWFVQRISLAKLSNSYQIKKLIVRPVCEKFVQIANASRLSR